MPRRIDRWARWSLLLALGLAGVGLYLRQSELAPFWGGLLLAFGEAALVGGLADWFAVRALFAHPLGIPFPHSALIPRNRRRITREIRQLVLTEWLPPALLRSRLEAFDFVGAGLLPMVEALRPRLRGLLRDLGHELFSRADPGALAAPAARALADALSSERLRSFLADLVRGARERRLLDPLLDDGVRRLQQWAGERRTWQILRRHLERAAESYQERGLARTLAFSVAELFGGLDLDGAATDLQLEMYRFLGDQLTGPGPMKAAVDDGLAGVECRLRQDPGYFEDLRLAVLENEGAGRLIPPLESVLSSLREEGLRELDHEDSRLVTAAEGFVDAWLARLGDDVKVRDQVNDWCRRLAVSLLERHHEQLGALVEEQMDRFSDRALTELIESRVGEDLNWIRLNGTFVGGLIGVVLYLLYTLVSFRA
jgi:uncharacterized membrane-anchored protein YjiN (DUF445 family)